MTPACRQVVATALKRDPTDAEIRNIEDRLVASMRRLAAKDRAAWGAKPQTDRLHEAAASAAKDLIGEQELKQRRTALQVAAGSRLETHLASQAARGITGLEAIDRTIAFHADARSDFLSVESQSHAIRADALRQMLGVLEASNPKWFGLFENHEGIKAITREIFGESTGNAAAAAGAKLWKTVTTALRERFNRGGGDVGELDDWGLPHHHSQSKIAAAGRQQWIADILPKLDRTRYVKEDGSLMSDPELNDFLGHAWETIATGGANKSTPGQFKGGSARANRGSASRQIHFKDADGYIDYQQKYGERSLYEILVGHIDGVSKDIGLVETYGPNPDQAFRLLRDRSVQEAKRADPTQLGKIEAHAINTENLYNEVAGKRLPVASRWLAASFDTLRSWMIASRLGSAIISSLSDEATLALTAHLNRLPLMRVFANELAAMNIANRQELRMARHAGLALNSLISSLNRFGQEGLGAAFSNKLANTVMRVSGLNAITEARKRAFGVTMMSSLGSIAKEHANLAALDPHDYRILKAKGITDTDFAMWKTATPEDWGGGNNTMLTPDAIYRMSDQDVDRVLGAKISGLAPGSRELAAARTEAREKAATRLLGTVLEESNVAIVEPGAKERVVTMSHIQRGTLKGELTRSVFLFKSFPLAMIQRHWNRGMDMPTGTGRAAYLATLIAGTTVAGVASLQLSELLSGRDPRNLNPAAKGGVRNWMAALLKGGSLGIYGDFLFSDQTRYGSGPVATALGPVVGLGEDVFNLTQGNLVQWLHGQPTDIGAESVKFARSNLPAASLWYTKAATDHLIFHQLQEYFSPGYLANMRSRAERDYGQKYWWEPGEAVPNRAPDLGAMGK